MKVEVKPEGDAWSLYVNGHLMIWQESFPVVDRVRDELEYPCRSYEYSEMSEVAHSILKWLEAHKKPMDPKYEITFPGAAAMIEQERRALREQKPWERIPAKAYAKRGGVGDEVTKQVSREVIQDWWQDRIDMLIALVDTMGNVPEFQVAILQEAAEQVREGRFRNMWARRISTQFEEECDKETKYAFYERTY